jgi:hypothetical protein
MMLREMTGWEVKGFHHGGTEDHGGTCDLYVDLFEALHSRIAVNYRGATRELLIACTESAMRF